MPVPVNPADKKPYFTLKWIAIICMVIDHTDWVFLHQNVVTDNTKFYIFLFLRLIGKIAFPIFAYELVEAFYYTEKRGYKAIRIFSLACISELFFDMAILGEISFATQNVCFTLFFGYVMLMMLDKAWAGNNKVVKYILVFFALMLACVMASTLKADYGYKGIILIFCFWIAHKLEGENKYMFIMSSCIAICALGVKDIFGTLGSIMYAGEILSGAFILLYETKRLPVIKGNIVLKFIGRWFYPMHLCILAIMVS